VGADLLFQLFEKGDPTIVVHRHSLETVEEALDVGMIP